MTPTRATRSRTGGLRAVAFVSLLPLLVILTASRAQQPGEWQWLEPPLEARPLAWASAHTDAAAKALQALPGYAALRDEVARKLSVERSTLDGAPVLLGPRALRLMRDAANPLGLLQAAPRREDGTPGEWKTILDVAALGKSEGKKLQLQWFGDPGCLPPRYDRCLLRLSDQGSDEAARVGGATVPAESILAWDLRAKATDPAGEDLVVQSVGLLQPAKLGLYRPGTQAKTLSADPALFDASRLVVETRTVKAVDGTPIGYWLVKPRQPAAPGETPTFMTGYGAFGASSATRRWGWPPPGCTSTTTPKTPAMHEVLLRYSPFRNVKTGGTSPAFFATVSTQDNRVGPGHARKLAGRIESVGAEVYSLEEQEGGHGVSDALEHRDLMAMRLDFLVSKQMPAK